MEITKNEPRATKDQSTSATGTMEGARRATGIVPMAGASAHLVNSAPDPGVPEKKLGANSHPNINLASWPKPMHATSQGKRVLCCAVKDFIHPT